MLSGIEASFIGGISMNNPSNVYPINLFSDKRDMLSAIFFII
jgi:hypothetical protein